MIKPFGNQQIANLVKDVRKQVAKKSENVNKRTYLSLFRMASPLEKLLLISGHLCAAVCGLAVPSSVYLIGDVFELLKDDQETHGEKHSLATFLALIGAGVWLTRYLAQVFLTNFALRLCNRIKQLYATSLIT